MDNGGIAAALEAGNAATAKKSRWLPVGIEYRGHLIAEVKDLRNDKVERLYLFRGETLYYGVGGTLDDPIAHRVTDRALKKIVRAMVHPDRPHWEDALNEAHAASNRELDDKVRSPSRARRKR